MSGRHARHFPTHAVVRELAFTPGLMALPWPGRQAHVGNEIGDPDEGVVVMAYLEPPAFTRHLVNPLVSRLQTGGVATLTVPGRRTGRGPHGAGHPGRGRGHPVPGVPVWRIAVGPQSARGWQGHARPQGQGGDLPGERDSGPGPGQPLSRPTGRSADAPWTRVSPNCQTPATIRCFA